MNDWDEKREQLIDAWAPFFETIRKATEIMASAMADFVYQYRRYQLLTWLLDHKIPIGPAEWLSEKCPKCLLPRLELEVLDE
jgi:hypothetical protein